MLTRCLRCRRTERSENENRLLGRDQDLDGDAVKDDDNDATLGRVACTALASYADEQATEMPRQRLITPDARTITTLNYQAA